MKNLDINKNKKSIAGYYYHVCAVKKNNKIYLPGFLSSFFDVLSQELKTLYLFLHEAKTESEFKSANTHLVSNNIIWINMGEKDPAWYRSIFAKKILNQLIHEFRLIDFLIVRCPSPLAPYFSNLEPLKKKLVFMIVSDYKKGAEMITVDSFRNFFVKKYTLYIDRMLKKSIIGNLLIVNSDQIYNDHKHLSKSIFKLRTTTIRNEDFYKRKNQNLGNPVKLLFTGRIVAQKGLKELLDCIKYFQKDKLAIELHIVGWEDYDKKPYESYLIEYSKKLKISSKIFFHGLKKVGNELNSMYRMADIYVLPSHHEGFPRTIWEAMANSLPVISTTVGSIPKYLKNNKHAILVPPKDPNALYYAVKLMISNTKLRNELVENSFQLVRNNTLELQTEKLINIISKELKSINKFE